MTGFTEETVSIMMDRFEHEYKIIRYSTRTNEIAIVHWGKYNINKLGGKPVMDCIRSELRIVEDCSLLEVILLDITKESIRQLYMEAIKGKAGEDYESRASSGVKSTDTDKKQNDSLYEKPSEEQLRRARELF